MSEITIEPEREVWRTFRGPPEEEGPKKERLERMGSVAEAIPPPPQV